MLVVRKIVGDSMLPTLKPGQLVYGWRSRNFKPGQVVIAFMNGGEVIKRIKSIDGGKVYLVGDNPDGSTDSRSHGSVPDTKVEAIVFFPRV